MIILLDLLDRDCTDSLWSEHKTNCFLLDAIYSTYGLCCRHWMMENMAFEVENLSGTVESFIISARWCFAALKLKIFARERRMLA